MFDWESAVGTPDAATTALLLSTDPTSLSDADAVAAAIGTVKARRMLEALELRFLAQAQHYRRHDADVCSVGQELSAATGMHPVPASCRTDLGCSAVVRAPT